MTHSERPWSDKADFAKTAKGLDSWTAIASAYTHRGYPVSRDTIRRAAEEHGIYPEKVNDSEVRTLRKEVKDLNKTLRTTRSTYEKQIADVRAQPREADPTELLEARKQVVILQARLKEEKDLNKTAVRDAVLIDEVREILTPVVAAYRLPAPKEPPRLPKSDGTPVSAVAVFCDQHWGKVVNPATVNGLNAYSPGIAALRHELFVSKFLKLSRLYSHEHQLDELVVVLNGDPINNDNMLHPHDAADACRVSKQVLDCALVTAQAIWEMSWHFPKIRVICPGGDNHGRGGRKPAAGIAAIQESWTALYNEFVASFLSHVEKVEFEHTPSYQALFDIKGRSFAAAHGHHLRGGGGQLGIPAYAMKRHHDSTVSKTVLLLKQQDWSRPRSVEDYIRAIASIVDHTIISHFHSDQKLDFGNGDVRIANSMVGTDTYVLNSLGKVATAGQKAFFVHPRHGIMGDHNIVLQSIMEEAPSRYAWGTLEDGTTGASIMREWLSDQPSHKA